MFHFPTEKCISIQQVTPEWPQLVVGDVLTGILTGFLGQGYSPEHAAMIGVYLHGKSGDLAALELTEESIIASDLIEFLPLAVRSVGNSLKWLIIN